MDKQRSDRRLRPAYNDIGKQTDLHVHSTYFQLLERIWKFSNILKLKAVLLNSEPNNTIIQVCTQYNNKNILDKDEFGGNIYNVLKKKLKK